MPSSIFSSTFPPKTPASGPSQSPTSGQDGYIPPHIPQTANSHSFLQFFEEYAHHLAYSAKNLKSHTFYPRFDVEEGETAYELLGELPGCKQGDIRIHEVDGFGIEIEGLTARFPPMNEDGSAKHVAVEAKTGLSLCKVQKHEFTCDKGADGVEKKTIWPDMADPDMDTAAEEAAAMSEAQDNVTSKAAEAEKHILKSARGSIGSDRGTMKELPKTFPHTLFHERQVGRFQRIIRFPGPVDTTKVVAELKEGILRVRVPKDLLRTEELEKEKRRIEVAWADASMWGL